MDLGGGTYPPKSWWGWAINVAHGLGPLVPHLEVQMDSAPQAAANATIVEGTGHHPLPPLTVPRGVQV